MHPLGSFRFHRQPTRVQHCHRQHYYTINLYIRIATNNNYCVTIHTTETFDIWLRSRVIE